MRVQNFKENIRLTCTREEFIQLRMAMVQRRDFLRNSISPDGDEDDLYGAFSHFKEVCDDMYEDMIQI